MSQIMSDLPKQRVTPFQPPFSVSGCDCYGPMIVKRGRSTAKRYGIIFTCFSTRAVHLDVIESMTTDSFLMALYRFTARRGPVKHIWCDNGTNFVGGARELREQLKELDFSRVEKSLASNEITWHFQTPFAPHTSGVWERLIRSIKTALKATLGSALVNDECLRTTLVRIESILNSRPITSVSTSLEDLEPLTPNHFINRSPANVAVDFNEHDQYRKQWRLTQYLLARYWDRWIKEYLPTLQIRSKWNKKLDPPSVGDLVLVANANTKRGQWPLGRIVNTYEGADGLARSVGVRTANGIVKRPIHGLCRLEGAPASVSGLHLRRSPRFAQRGECESDLA
jgi:hypothetical protein